jgi:hypothetical protein
MDWKGRREQIEREYRKDIGKDMIGLFYVKMKSFRGGKTVS